MCDGINGVCSSRPIDYEVDKPFTDAQTNRMLRDIFNGKTTPDSLPVDTYNTTGELLTRGAIEGIKDEQLLGLGYMPDQSFIDALQDNAYKFAGAKTLDEVLLLSNELTDENGNARSWSEFKNATADITENHRVHWLRAEYNNAMSSAQMASKWDDLVNDDDFPYLKYITANDGRVRNDHARLDGTILPKESPFWSNYYPPNGWNCRCTVVKMSDLFDDEVTPNSQIPVIDQPDEFNVNVGTHRILFSPEHPYFVAAERHQKALDVLPKPGNVGGAKRVDVEKEFKEPKIEKIDGFVGGFGRGNLKGTHALMQKDFESKTGIEVPDILFEQLPRANRQLHYSDEEFNALPKDDRGAHYSPFRNRVTVDPRSKRFKRSTRFAQQVTAHELGHAHHFQNEIITYNKVDDRIKTKFVNTFKQEIESKYKNEGAKRWRYKAFDNDLNELSSKYWNAAIEEKDPKKKKELWQKFEDVSSLSDTLMGVTRGQHGKGHLKSYMNDGNTPYMEIYAHLFENYFVGNPIFKELMPKSYEFGQNYIKEILFENDESNRYRL